MEAFLIAFEGQHIIGLFIGNNLPGDIFLTAHGVDGDDAALDIQ